MLIHSNWKLDFKGKSGYGEELDILAEMCLEERFLPPETLPPNFPRLPSGFGTKAGWERTPFFPFLQYFLLNRVVVVR